VTETEILLFLSGWGICGIINYGILKNYWRQFYRINTYFKYGFGDEIFCISAGVLGYAGFLGALFFVLVEGDGFGFCYLMPKELCLATPDLAKRDEPRRPE